MDTGCSPGSGDLVVDHRTADFAETVTDADVVLDTIGGGG